MPELPEHSGMIDAHKSLRGARLRGERRFGRQVFTFLTGSVWRIDGSWGGWMPFLGPLGGCWGCQWMRSGTVIYRMHCCHAPSAGISPGCLCRGGAWTCTHTEGHQGCRAGAQRHDRGAAAAGPVNASPPTGCRVLL